MTVNRLNNPTLCLSGFDPHTIVKQYLNGDYDHLTIDDLPKFTSNSLLIKLIQEELPTDFNELRFVIRDPNNNRLIIQTANKVESKPIICSWHRGPLEDDNPGIMIPVSYRTWHSSRLKCAVHEFRGERVCCSYSCMLAAMYDSKRYNEENERYARHLWKLHHPDQLFPVGAPDYEFIDINRGSLTEGEFKNNNSINMPIKIISCAEARHIAQISR